MANLFGGDEFPGGNDEFGNDVLKAYNVTGTYDGRLWPALFQYHNEGGGAFLSGGRGDDTLEVRDSTKAEFNSGPGNDVCITYGNDVWGYYVGDGGEYCAEIKSDKPKT